MPVSRNAPHLFPQNKGRHRYADGAHGSHQGRRIVLRLDAETHESQRIRAALDAAVCDITDRDMLVGWFLEYGGNRLGGKPFPSDAAQELRARIGVKPDEFLDVYPEYVLSEPEREAWLATRTGAIAGRQLAERYGWKVGDKVPITATIWTRSDGRIKARYPKPPELSDVFDLIDGMPMRRSEKRQRGLNCAED